MVARSYAQAAKPETLGSRGPGLAGGEVPESDNVVTF